MHEMTHMIKVNNKFYYYFNACTVLCSVHYETQMILSIKKQNVLVIMVEQCIRVGQCKVG